MTDMRWDAGLYRHAHTFVYERAGDVFSLLAPQRGEGILDAGCGTGELTARIAESGARVVGVDASEDMILSARAAHPKVEFHCRDLTSLAYEARFDAVFSNAVLHWIAQDRQPDALNGLFRALKPGGRFAAEMGGAGNVERVDAALRGALGARGLALREQNYFPSPAAYATLLEGAGFSIRLIEKIERPTPLSGAREGLRNWYAMFRAKSLEPLKENEREDVLSATEEALRPALYQDGRWTADYVRLRFLVGKLPCP